MGASQIAHWLGYALGGWVVISLVASPIIGRFLNEDRRSNERRAFLKAPHYTAPLDVPSIREGTSASPERLTANR